MADWLSILSGAASGIQSQVEKRQEAATKIQQIMAEAKAKQMYPDPMTAFLMKQFGIGGNPSQDASSPFQPTGMNVKGMKFELPPEQTAQRASLVAQERERAKQAANIPAAIRAVKVHLDQFQRAFPSGNRSQALQTAIGLSKNWIGLQTGIGISPEQRAVLKTLPLATIGLVRVSGALGRVSNQELDAAGTALNQATLTDEERVKMARNLSEQYLARVEPKDFQEAIHRDPELGTILSDFGVPTPTPVSSESDSVKARLRARYAR